MRVEGGRERVQRLLELSRALLAEPEQRRVLCERWREMTGLSAQGVAWALEHCLELWPSAPEIDALLAAVPQARRAHVILPAQVFVAAQRAIALGLASAPEVFVRPSRRDPVLAQALAARGAGLFQCVDQLDVEPGDHVWAYGADLTLSALRAQLPAGAVLHAHGSGFGVALVDLDRPQSLPDAARAIAEDTLCFDQRGCLSPRLVLALGSPSSAQSFAEALACALADAGRRVPRGAFSADELAEESWYRQCLACFASIVDTGHGSVSVRALELSLVAAQGLAALVLPPAGRHLQIVPVERLEPALGGLERWLTSVGCATLELEQRARAVLSRARVVPLGRMQSPAFDGPVDRRSDPRGELI
ncbi:MAG TPA: acyl-CoA reductase [Polyangiaceae bacterium]|nr:acyl-CoA reductase [Polyangiaceae bacterium]